MNTGALVFVLAGMCHRIFWDYLLEFLFWRLLVGVKWWMAFCPGQDLWVG
jgi:hypothetical protein